jgi:hypothetical protein
MQGYGSPLNNVLENNKKHLRFQIKLHLFLFFIALIMPHFHSLQSYFQLLKTKNALQLPHFSSKISEN